MSFAIIADLPLGTYRAGFGEGQPDSWPSPARLHAALLSTAALGLHAVDRDGHLHPSDAAIAALEWLESNPPDGLALPTSSSNRTATATYRDLGLLGPKRVGTRMLLKRDHDSVALGGSIVWVWQDLPPKTVRDCLEDLCPEVPYLGRSDSPVRLRTAIGQHEATHRRDPERRRSRSRRDVVLPAAAPGRTQALRDAHRDGTRTRPPTLSNDRTSADEADVRPANVTSALRSERFAPIGEPDRQVVPWQRVWLAPLAEGTPAIPLDQRVRWAVATHRALIALHGDDAPALLTGDYLPGVARPANRLSIQVVDQHPMQVTTFASPQALALAVPSDADPLAVSELVATLDELRVVRSRGAALHLAPPAERPVPADGAAYWKPCAGGATRLWVAAPAVPETRPPGKGGWSLEQTVAVSVAHVFRSSFMDDELAALPRDARLRALSQRVLDRGVEVLSVRRLATSDVGRWVHKVPQGLVVQPYVATLTLGDLIDEGEAWLALGQSRHLGGGMLSPLDIHPAMLDVWRQR